MADRDLEAYTQKTANLYVEACGDVQFELALALVIWEGEDINRTQPKRVRLNGQVNTKVACPG